MVVAISIYLVVGVISLWIFNAKTGRIKKKWDSALDNTQRAMLVRRKEAIAIFVIGLWIFWPTVFYGAIESKLRGIHAEKQNEESSQN